MAGSYCYLQAAGPGEGRASTDGSVEDLAHHGAVMVIGGAAGRAARQAAYDIARAQSRESLAEEHVDDLDRPHGAAGLAVRHQFHCGVPSHIGIQPQPLVQVG
ncbi:hypothetical protein OG933_01050 [Streptomyces sp. NBC_00016]